MNLSFLSLPSVSIPLLFVGFIALVKGADLLVDGASSIAKSLQIPELVIGLTIVAFGTSLPELLVTTFASYSGSADLAIGNVIGSNISNLLLILGVCAVIYPLSVSKGTVWKEIPLNILALTAVLTLVNDQFLDQQTENLISRTDGVILMLFFIIFLYYSFGMAFSQKKNHELLEDSGEKTSPPFSTSKSVIYILLGTLLLPIGGQLVINGSNSIAQLLNLSQSFIGLTLLALGTSAPELATSALATYKKNTDIAIGNVVGSNVFNIFWVLGVSAAIKPLPFNTQLNIDLLACTVATLLLFIFIAIRSPENETRWWVFKIKREGHSLSKTEGIIFIGLYCVYLAYLMVRG